MTPNKVNDTKQESVGVGTSVKERAEIPPSIVGTVLTDLSFDLLHLELDKGRVDVAISGVQIGKNAEGLVSSSVCVQPNVSHMKSINDSPSGRFREKHHEGHENDKRGGLKDEWYTPGPLGSSSTKGYADTGSDDLTDWTSAQSESEPTVVARVEETENTTTFGGWRDLGEVCNGSGSSETETTDDTRGKKHIVVLRKAGKEGAQDTGNVTEKHCPSSTKLVGEPVRRNEGDNGTSGTDTEYNTGLGRSFTGEVKVGLVLRHGVDGGNDCTVEACY